jgi:hypothetical protein
MHRFLTDVLEEQLKARESSRHFLAGVAIQALGTIAGGTVLALAAALVGILDFVGRLAAGLSLLAVVTIAGAGGLFVWRSRTKFIEADLPRLLRMVETPDLESRANGEPDP